MTDPVAILVVEDDVPTRTFLADNLTADGYALLTAGSVRDAVRALEYHRVDLAIVDVGLPDDSGLELLRRIREAGGGEHMTVSSRNRSAKSAIQAAPRTPRGRLRAS